MRIGLFGGDTAGRTIDDVVADARDARELGFTFYTLPQIFALDAMAVLGHVGAAVPDIELATGVVPTYTRHPLVMAQQALTTQAAAGGRFVLGIGLSHQWVVEQMLGASFDKPVRHMREYLSALLPLLRGEATDVDGETVRAHFALTTIEIAPVRVLVAALGTQMLQLAGRLTDGTVTWMTGPRTLADHTVPTIRAAAEAAGRPEPRVAASLPVSLTADVDGARARAAEEYQVYGMLPSYRAMLDREGAGGPADVAIVGDEQVVERSVRELAGVGVTDFAAAVFGSREERTRTRAFLATLSL